jgi:hypothetical protein
MITSYGAVPYPSWVDSRPLTELGNSLRSLYQGMMEGATAIRDTARQPWSGSAADRYAEHAIERAQTITLLAEVASQAAPVMETYAAAIESSQAAYSEAARVELHMRNYLPASLVAVEGAMAAEVAAIVALGAAGTAFAAALSALMLKAEAADTFGITRNPYEVVRDAITNIVDTWNSDDRITAIVRAANETATIEHADGSRTQFNILGLSIDAITAIRRIPLRMYEVVGGVVGLMNATPLTIRQADADHVERFTQGGFTFQPNNVRELGNNLALTEEFQRARGTATGSEPDQSSVVPYSVGRTPEGQRVVTMHVPGIVPPGAGSWNGNSGERNVTGATLSQVTGLGAVETSIRQQLQNLNVRRGDRVNLYGHSYGGIAARNVANALAREGIEVAFVSYGSPDGPIERGVEAYMVQNPNDPVPAARAGGDGRAGGTFASNQDVILVHQRATGDVFNNHDSRFYGDNLTRTPNLELNDFLRRQRRVTVTDQGIVMLEGPRLPNGAENKTPQPYLLPAPKTGP